jgi:cobalt-zinc-cadmium efflux system outer membrane protein
VIIALVTAVLPAAAQSVVPRPLGAGLIVNRPVNADPESARAPENPTGRITLRDARALALRQSPELASFAWEVRARESLVIQAGRPPNPVADVLFEDLGASAREADGGRIGEPHATVQLSQLIELGGKRPARQALAGLDRDLAEWDFEAARLDVLTRVTTAFLDVLARQHAVALTAQTRALVEQLDQTVRSRVEAGVVSPIDQTKAGVALALSRIEEQRARRALTADRTALAALWGHQSAAFELAEGDLLSLPPLPAFDALEPYVTQHPDVARWTTEIARRDAVQSLERARGVPDITVSAGYRRFTAADGNAFVVGASIPLPLLDRNRAAMRAAAERVAQAREAERAARFGATATLAAAYRELAAAHDEAAALAVNVLPGARSAFAAVEEGYRLGRFGYLDVLDAQRTLVAAELQHSRAVAAFHRSAAHVEWLIGMSLAVVARPPARRPQEQP